MQFYVIYLNQRNAKILWLSTSIEITLSLINMILSCVSSVWEALKKPEINSYHNFTIQSLCTSSLVNWSNSITKQFDGFSEFLKFHGLFLFFELFFVGKILTLFRMAKFKYEVHKRDNSHLSPSPLPQNMSVKKLIMRNFWKIFSIDIPTDIIQT